MNCSKKNLYSLSNLDLLASPKLVNRTDNICSLEFWEIREGLRQNTFSVHSCSGKILLTLWTGSQFFPTSRFDHHRVKKSWRPLPLQSQNVTMRQLGCKNASLQGYFVHLRSRNAHSRGSFSFSCILFCVRMAFESNENPCQCLVI